MDNFLSEVNTNNNVSCNDAQFQPYQGALITSLNVQTRDASRMCGDVTMTMTVETTVMKIIKTTARKPNAKIVSVVSVE